MSSWNGKALRVDLTSGRIDKEKFPKMLEEYYALRGWHRDTGIPSRQTLEEYGLQDVADDLE